MKWTAGSTASSKFTPTTLCGHTRLSDCVVTVNNWTKPSPQAQMLEDQSRIARSICPNGGARGARLYIQTRSLSLRCTIYVSILATALSLPSRVVILATFRALGIQESRRGQAHLGPETLIGTSLLPTLGNRQLRE